MCICACVCVCKVCVVVVVVVVVGGEGETGGAVRRGLGGVAVQTLGGGVRLDHEARDARRVIIEQRDLL